MNSSSTHSEVFLHFVDERACTQTVFPTTSHWRHFKNRLTFADHKSNGLFSKTWCMKWCSDVNKATKGQGRGQGQTYNATAKATAPLLPTAEQLKWPVCENLTKLARKLRNLSNQATPPRDRCCWDETWVVHLVWLAKLKLHGSSFLVPSSWHLRDNVAKCHEEIGPVGRIEQGC